MSLSAAPAPPPAIFLLEKSSRKMKFFPNFGYIVVIPHFYSHVTPTKSLLYSRVSPFLSFRSCLWQAVHFSISETKLIIYNER